MTRPAWQRASLLFAVALALRWAVIPLYGDAEIIQAGTLARHVAIARSVHHGTGVRLEAPGAPPHPNAAATPGDLAQPAPDPAHLVVPQPVDTPGFGLLLAGTWRLTGLHTLVPVQVLQTTVDAAAAVALVTVVAALGGAPAIAWGSGWLYAVWPPAIRLAVNPHRDLWAPVGLLLVLCCALLAARALGRRRWAWGAAATLLGFAAAWLRPTLPVLVLGTAAAVAVCWPVPRRTRAVAVLALSTGAVLFFASFAAWNQHTYGRPWAMVASLGKFQNLGEFDNPWGFGVTDGSAVDWARAHGITAPPLTLEWDDALKTHVNRALAERPWLPVRNALLRLPQAFAAGWADVATVPPGLRFRDYLAAAPGRTAVTYALDNPWLFAVRFGAAPVTWLLAAVGLWLWRRSWRVWLPLMAGPALLWAFALGAHVENRTLASATHGALPALAAFCWFVLQRWSGRQRRDAATIEDVALSRPDF